MIVQFLEACIRSKLLIDGKKVHQYLLKTGILEVNNSLLLEKLTHLYITCAKVELAWRVFSRAGNPSPGTCNMMIRAYAQDSRPEEAVNLYGWMLRSSIRPTNFTFPVVLKACASLHSLNYGREKHSHVIRFGLDSDTYVCTALIDLYAKFGCFVEAKRVFSYMPYRDVVAWNAMIAGLSFHGLYYDAIDLVAKLQEEGINPNTSTIVSVLPTVAQTNALNQGKAMHGYCLRKSFGNDVVLSTGLLDMYAKCRWLSYARRIFDAMGLRNEVTWTAMIGAYILCDLMCEAFKLFGQMVLTIDPTPVTLGCILRACAKPTDLGRGKRLHCYILKLGFLQDLMVGNTLLSMYSKCRVVEDAARFFDEMILKDSVSYSAMISGFAQSGMAEEALITFRCMRILRLDAQLATMVGVLPACAHLVSLDHGSCCHGFSIVHGFTDDTPLCNTIIDMYSKCGRVEIARKVFDRMPQHNIVSFNTMILGYGIHGLGEEALLLFQDLCTRGMIKPDHVTFTCLLSACSHAGLVSAGKHCFDVMSREFNIFPRMEHYLWITDLLGRAGHLEEAHNFVLEMPFEPDVCVWSALLTACKRHNNFELGEEILKIIQGLGPPKGAESLILMSNIFSTMGRWDDAANVRVVQRDFGLRKSPGRSQLG